MNTITARTIINGIHHWPDAPEHRAYLTHPHRHAFHIAATVHVDHADRDVEFHDLAELLHVTAARIGTTYHPESTLIDYGPRSCEVLAGSLATILEARGLLVHTITVSEDGENDSTVTR